MSGAMVGGLSFLESQRSVDPELPLADGATGSNIPAGSVALLEAVDRDILQLEAQLAAGFICRSNGTLLTVDLATLMQLRDRLGR